MMDEARAAMERERVAREVRLRAQYRRSDIISAIRAERARCDVLGYTEEHDDQHTASWWFSQIEQRAAAARTHMAGTALHRRELVQIAALAVAAIERIDRIKQQ